MQIFDNYIKKPRAVESPGKKEKQNNDTHETQPL